MGIDVGHLGHRRAFVLLILFACLVKRDHYRDKRTPHPASLHDRTSGALEWGLVAWVICCHNLASNVSIYWSTKRPETPYSGC